MLKISLDAGALTSHKNDHYGNYTFSHELIKTLYSNRKNHQYFLYLQKENKNFPQFCSRVLKPKFGWLKIRISLEELFRPSHIFLALNQALPWYCPGKKIVFCHGIAPLIYPNLYPESQLKLTHQIKEMLKRADYIVVGSKKLKSDIININKKEIKNNIRVINYGIPSVLLKQTKKFPKKDELLYVGSAHPIKNINFILKAFNLFLKQPEFNHYRLLLVGVGSQFNFLPKTKRIKIIGYAQQSKLVQYYQQTRCLVTASLSESFNLPVLEALSQNTQVVGTKSAIIPELRPYSNLSSNNLKQFVKTIIKSIQKPKLIDQNRLRHQFSWQNYIRKMTRLYE